MNVAETTKLVDLIAGIVPAQRFTVETPALWAGVLRDVRLADALEAARRVPRREGFIDPSDIVAEVKVLRQERRESVSAETIIPNVDPDDVLAFNAERLAIMRAAGDGRLDADLYRNGNLTLTGAPVRQAITAEMISKPGVVEAATIRMFQRTPTPTSEDYQGAPMPSRTVGPDRAAADHAERIRQQAALVAIYGPDIANGAPIPAGPEGYR